MVYGDSLLCPPDHLKWSLVRRLERPPNSIHMDEDVSVLVQVLVNKHLAVGRARLDWLQVGHSASQLGTEVLCAVGCSIGGRNK